MNLLNGDGLTVWLFNHTIDGDDTTRAFITSSGKHAPEEIKALQDTIESFLASHDNHALAVLCESGISLEWLGR